MATSLIGVFVSDWSAVKENGFLQGYSMLVWIVISLQVCVNSCTFVAAACGILIGIRRAGYCHGDEVC